MFYILGWKCCWECPCWCLRSSNHKNSKLNSIATHSYSDVLTHSCLMFYKKDICKQCRLRTDATLRSIRVFIDYIWVHVHVLLFNRNKKIIKTKISKPYTPNVTNGLIQYKSPQSINGLTEGKCLKDHTS